LARDISKGVQESKQYYKIWPRVWENTQNTEVKNKTVVGGGREGKHFFRNLLFFHRGFSKKFNSSGTLHRVADISENLGTFIFRINQSWKGPFLGCWILKMKAPVSTETSVTVYRPIRRNMPKALNLHKSRFTKLWHFSQSSSSSSSS